jgi:hypothetical protein
MAIPKPQSRPEPPASSDPAKPGVYGGQWGSSGKQSDSDKGQTDPGQTDKGQTDRPAPIEAPPGPTGSPDPGEV